MYFGLIIIILAGVFNMKRISKMISLVVSSGVLVSGVARSLNKDMLEKVSAISYLPKNVDSALERYFKGFEMGMKTRFIGNISPALVGVKAKLSGYEYMEIDISDDESVGKFTGKFESLTDKNGSGKVRLVVSLKNIDCRNVKRFRKICKNLLNHDGVMIYVYSPSRDCKNEKCENCQDLNYELKAFSDVRRVVCAVPVSFVDANRIAKELVDNWKEMIKKGELDVDVNLDNDDIEFFAFLILFCDVDYLSDLIKHAFVASLIRSSNGKAVLCLEDFMKIFMDSYAYASPDIGASDMEGYCNAAVHEMGHAVCAHLLGSDVLGIVLRENFDGVTLRKIDQNMQSYEKLIISAKVSLAGKLAGKLIGGHDSDGASSDLEKVKSFLNKAASIKYPMADSIELSRIVNELYSSISFEVKKLISKNSRIIERMAKRLADRKAVNGLKVIKRSEFLKLFDDTSKEVREETQLRVELLKMIESKKLTEELVSKLRECLNGMPDNDIYLFSSESSNGDGNMNDNKCENGKGDDTKKKSELVLNSVCS